MYIALNLCVTYLCAVDIGCNIAKKNNIVTLLGSSKIEQLNLPEISDLIVFQKFVLVIL